MNAGGILLAFHSFGVARRPNFGFRQENVSLVLNARVGLSGDGNCCFRGPVKEIEDISRGISLGFLDAVCYCVEVFSAHSYLSACT